MLVAQAQGLAAKFERYGIDVPKEARDVFDCLRIASDAATSSAVEDLRVDIMAGKITPQNVRKRMDEVALANVLRPGHAATINECDAAFGNVAMRALRGDPGRILDQLRPQFLEHAAVVKEATRYFDDASFTSPEGVLIKFPHAAELYARLKTEMRVLDDMRSLVSEVCRLDVARIPSAAVFIAASPAGGLPQFTGSAPWLTLWEHADPALNTPDQARQIVADAQAAIVALKQRPRTAKEEHDRNTARVEADRWAALAAGART